MYSNTRRAAQLIKNTYNEMVYGVDPENFPSIVRSGADEDHVFLEFDNSDAYGGEIFDEGEVEDIEDIFTAALQDHGFEFEINFVPEFSWNKARGGFIVSIK